MEEEYPIARADRESGSPAGRLLTRRMGEGRFTERGVKHAASRVSFVRVAPVTVRLRQPVCHAHARVRNKVVPRNQLRPSGWGWFCVLEEVTRMTPGMSVINLIGLLLTLAGAVEASLALLIADRWFPEHENARVWLNLPAARW